MTRILGDDVDAGLLRIDHIHYMPPESTRGRWDTVRNLDNDVEVMSEIVD